MSDIPNNPEIRLAIARSKLVDAFATAETAAIERLRSLGREPKSVFSQNAALLAKCPASPKYSKSCKAGVDNALKELAALHPLRCDAVHGALEIVNLQGQQKACFRNPQKADHHSELARVIDEQQMTCLTEKIQKLAGEIKPK